MVSHPVVSASEFDPSLPRFERPSQVVLRMRLILPPSAEDFARMESSQPGNPFAMRGYAMALAATGAHCGILEWHGKHTLQSIASIRRGRIGSTLEIPSLAGPIDSDDLTRLIMIARDHGVTQLAIRTFGSPAGTRIEARVGVNLSQRAEHLWSLPVDGGIISSLSRTHRERVRKAEKAGVVIEELASDTAVPTLIGLHQLSISRREARGENVSSGSGFELGQPLIDFAGARVFAARLGSEVIAAVLVAVAPQGAYTVYSGNAPAGMQIGAAHLIRVRLAEALWKEGRPFLNLGGASPGQEGLADFKRRFGAERIDLEHAEVDVAVGWRRFAIRLKNTLKPPSAPADSD